MLMTILPRPPLLGTAAAAYLLHSPVEAAMGPGAVRFLGGGAHMERPFAHPEP